MSSFSSCTDFEIWSAFKAGDDNAYEYIYHRHSRELFSYGFHIENDRQLVEDCLHDLFVYLFQHRVSLGNTNSIKYYLFKSLRRRIVEAIEKQNRIIAESNGLAHYYTIESSVPSPEGKIIETESDIHQNQRLATALQNLPTRQREAVYLLYFSNLSYSEIAEIMSLNIRTVYNQIHTAIQSLRKELRQSDVYRLPVFLE